MSIIPAVCHALYTGHNLAADQFYLLCIAGSVGVIGIHSLSLTPDAGRASSCYFPYPLFLPSILPFLDSFLRPVTSSVASLPDKTFFPLFDLYFYSRSLPPVAIICKHHHTRNIHIYIYAPLHLHHWQHPASNFRSYFTLSLFLLFVHSAPLVSSVTQTFPKKLI